MPSNVCIIRRNARRESLNYPTEIGKGLLSQSVLISENAHVVGHCPAHTIKEINIQLIFFITLFLLFFSLDLCFIKR